MVLEAFSRGSRKLFLHPSLSDDKSMAFTKVYFIIVLTSVLLETIIFFGKVPFCSMKKASFFQDFLFSVISDKFKFS